MKQSQSPGRGLFGGEPESGSPYVWDSAAFKRLYRIGQDLQGHLPDKLKLAIIKEEAYRAGINYLWHPQYREYAKTPGNHPYDYEKFYNDPKNRSVRDEQARLLTPFSNPQPIKKLLAMHPEMQQYWGHLGEDVRMSQGELVARHNYLLKEFGLENDPKWGPYFSHEDVSLAPKLFISGREVTGREQAARRPVSFAQNERAELRSDAVPSRPGPGQDHPSCQRRPDGQRDRNNPTWKKIQAEEQERSRTRAAGAETKAAGEKGIAPEARAGAESSAPGWPKGLGAGGWPDGEQKPAEERPKPQWQIRSDAQVEKNRQNDYVASMLHAGKFDSRSALSMDKLQDRAMDLEAEKAGLKPADHPYRHGVSRDDPEARDSYTGRKKIDSPPLFGDRTAHREKVKKITPHLKKESVFDHLAKDKYKDLAWMYKGFNEYSLKHHPRFKMTESELEACYEQRKRFEIEAEQARKHSTLHSAAKPHSLVSAGTSAGMSAMPKGVWQKTGPFFGAYFGGLGAEIDHQFKADYLRKIGIQVPTFAGGEDIAWGALNGAVSTIPGVGLPLTSGLQILGDSINGASKK